MKAIAAMSENRVIGVHGRIPWHLPADFKWFKRATMGGVIVMGRKTFESLGRPLPGRENVVVSRTMQDCAGVQIIRDIDAVSDVAFPGRDVWVIGGGELYRALLPRCSDLFLSEVRGFHEGDAFFPSIDGLFVEEQVVEEHPEFRVVHYVRSGQRLG